MIQHIVAFSPKPGQEAQVPDVMAGLAALIGQIDGFVAFSHGRNIDVEGKSQAYAYAFSCTFTDRGALDAYASDPRHQALGAQLVALAENGYDGLMIIDIESDL